MRCCAAAKPEMKLRKPVPPTTSASRWLGHVAALRRGLDRVAADEHRRAEAEDERDHVEEAGDVAYATERRAVRASGTV